jgi:hypothetical protein
VVESSLTVNELLSDFRTIEDSWWQTRGRGGRQPHSTPAATPARGRILLTGGLLLHGFGACSPQGLLGVDQHPFSLPGRSLRYDGELAGDPAHRCLGLVLPGRAAHP